MKLVVTKGLLLLGVALAAATSPDKVARSYTTGSVTCYFACPPAPNGQSSFGSFRSTTVTQDESCFYLAGGGIVEYHCNYNFQTGAYDSNGSDYLCVAYGLNVNAPQGPCTSNGNPDPSTYWKRDKLIRSLSESENRLKSRQYKPKSRTDKMET